MLLGNQMIMKWKMYLLIIMIGKNGLNFYNLIDYYISIPSNLDPWKK